MGSETGNLSIKMVKSDVNNGMKKIVMQLMYGDTGFVVERLQRGSEEPRYSSSGYRFSGIQIEEKENAEDVIQKFFNVLNKKPPVEVNSEFAVDEEVQDFPCLDTFLQDMKKDMKTLLDYLSGPGTSTGQWMRVLWKPPC